MGSTQFNRLDLQLRVLGYFEDGYWVAHCLDMDIMGHGNTFEEAKAALADAIRAQISFAIFKNNLGLLWNPAPAPYHAMFQDATRRALVSQSQGYSEIPSSIQYPDLDDKIDFEPAYV